MPSFIPNLDPNPLPAPYWVFKLLLLVTFFLHIVAMNFLLGGAVLAVASRWFGGSNRDRMFFDIAKKLPSLVPFTVTIGIAPLLFLQVLYGQYFYTSSVILGWPWFLVLVLLTIAYYGLYYVSFHTPEQPGRAANVMWLSVVLIFIIGFLYSNNVTLSQTPERWSAKYFADPSGWNLNLSEPSLFPRYLHFFVSAVAVGGLMLVFLALARWTKEPEYARGLFRLGGKAYLYATMAQFIVGTGFLFGLPRPLRKLFMGGNVVMTALFAIGFVLAGVAIMMMSRALREQNIHRAAYGVTGVTAVVILVMTAMRDMLRDAYLAPYFHPGDFAVKTQWSVFPLFLVLFLAGVALWVVMLKRYGLFSLKAGGK